MKQNSFIENLSAAATGYILQVTEDMEGMDDEFPYRLELIGENETQKKQLTQNDDDDDDSQNHPIEEKRPRLDEEMIMPTLDSPLSDLSDGQNNIDILTSAILNAELGFEFVPINEPAVPLPASTVVVSSSASLPKLQPKPRKKKGANYSVYDDLFQQTRLTPPIKPCHCAKSKCLKLYCDCFANGQYCQGCDCTNCCNTIEMESERKEAIIRIQEKNPTAFEPKIGNFSSVGEAHARQHTKGCHCSKSGCLRKYCECFQAKVFCSNICRCVNCHNGFMMPSTSHNLLVLPGKQQQQQLVVKPKTKQFHLEESLMEQILSTSQTNLGSMASPIVFRDTRRTISHDLVTSVVQLLLAKAEAAEEKNAQEGEIEEAILHEFGDVLTTIVNYNSIDECK